MTMMFMTMRLMVVMVIVAMMMVMVVVAWEILGGFLRHRSRREML